MNSSQQSEYDAKYYANCCGEPYQRNDIWLSFFSRIADHIVSELQPHSALDAGCAMGFLVEALRKRGVDAWGVDGSEYAIHNVLTEFQPFCKIGLITDPFPQPRYDLIICMEVIEHLSSDEAPYAVENLCKHSNDILLSSNPFDFHEPTHINVQPPQYWAEIFNRFGFIHDIDFDASFIAPWAMRFVKVQSPLEDRIRDYERKIWHLSQQNALMRNLIVEHKAEFFQKEMDLRSELNGIRQSNSWRFMKRVQHLREQLIPIGSRREAAMRVILNSIISLDNFFKKFIPSSRRTG
jgi:hypothetical protein